MLPGLEDFKKEFGIVPFAEGSYKFDEDMFYAHVYNDGHRLEIQVNWKDNKGYPMNKYAYHRGTLWDHGIRVDFGFRGLRSTMFVGIDNVDPELDRVREWEYIGFHNLKYGVSLIFVRRDNNPRAFDFSHPKEQV